MEKWRIRAAQLDLARQKENLEFVKSFIDFIARYGYNTLLLYLEGKIRTKTFPYPSPEKSYSPEEMKEVVAYARKKKIDVIPAVSNLGHTELFLQHPQLKHMMELREGIPGRISESVVCPSLDETYDFFESYFADMAEIFPSQYFHVGCDESWDMGICSLCRARAKRDGEHSLFTNHLVRTHRFLTGKLKKRMMMWDDMFEAYPESVKAIPRDIIMCSWFYDSVFDVPRSHFYNRKAEDVFRRYDKLGIPYLICPRENEITNILSCTSYARKYNPMGGLVTSWEKATSFMYKHFPIMAFAGLLWSTQKAQRDITEKICQDIFASDSPALVDTMNLYFRRGSWPGTGISTSFISGTPSLYEQTRMAETQLLAGALKTMKVSAGNTTGRRVLEDMRTEVAEEAVSHAMRTLIPEFYQASISSRPAGKASAGIRECARQMRELAEKRARHWKEWRKGVSPDTASTNRVKCAESYEILVASRRPSALLNMYCFLPDVYAAPKSRLSLWDPKKRSWQEVFSGSLKPRMVDDVYYKLSIPVYKQCSFSKIRIEVWNFGGHGFRFLELITKKGRFIPGRVEAASGIVRDAQHIIFDDYRWTYLGEMDVYKTYHNRRIAETVHSITVSLEKDV